MSTQSALIESILKRKGGTRVKLDDTDYHFVADDDGRHIASVSDADHIAKLLAIPEGFRLARAPKAAPSSAAAVGINAAPVTNPAPVVQDEPVKAAVDTGPLDTLDIEVLREVFKVEMGRDPSHRAKESTLIAQIEAMREEKAAKA